MVSVHKTIYDLIKITKKNEIYGETTTKIHLLYMM